MKAFTKPVARWTGVAAGLLAVMVAAQTALAAAAAQAANSQSASGSRPNIVVILVDDMGFSDIGCYGGVKFVDEAIAAKKPFFLYLAHNAPHFPLQAPQEDIAKFRGRYKVGWDKLRAERHARQISLGIVDKAWALSPRPAEVSAWHGLTAAEQDRFDHIMAIYAATVAHMDTSVGRLVDALRDRGVLDNTLLLFLSDNGANAESGPNGRLEGKVPGSSPSVVFQGQSWATLSNTPLRRYKHYDHEGGIATPLVVHWPAQIKTPGALRRQSGHVVDVMATCVDVAGAKYPAEFHGKPILPMEGKSLVPALDMPIGTTPIICIATRIVSRSSNRHSTACTRTT